MNKIFNFGELVDGYEYKVVNERDISVKFHNMPSIWDMKIYEKTLWM